jgi:hypothetical protein
VVGDRVVDEQRASTVIAVRRIAWPCGGIRAAVRALLRDRAGGMAVLIALGAPLVIGGAGLGVETGLWYVNKRRAQTAADAAAVAAALQIMRGQPRAMAASALADAERNGFSAALSDAITINHPPTSGPQTGDRRSVEVIVSREVRTMFAALFFRGGATIRARAVAGVQTNGTACVLALDPTAHGTVAVQGNAHVSLRGCLAAANSSSVTTVDVAASSALAAETLWTVGDYGRVGGGTITLNRPPHTQMSALPDPYAYATIPANPGSCKGGSAGRVIERGTGTLTPGVYCAGIRIDRQATVTMMPGTYYVIGMDFVVQPGATVRCDCAEPGAGVTIVLMRSSGGAVGIVAIRPGATMRLQAPSDPSYPYPGVLFFQDRGAPRDTATSRFNGGAGMSLAGALYLPSTAMELAGNTDATLGSRCLVIVARLVRFSGNAKLEGSQCSQYGTQLASMTAVRLLD